VMPFGCGMSALLSKFTSEAKHLHSTTDKARKFIRVRPRVQRPRKVLAQSTGRNNYQ